MINLNIYLHTSKFKPTICMIIMNETTSERFEWVQLPLPEFKI